MSGDKQPVGFIGLGNMGHYFAENLGKAGHPLHVVDVRPEITEAWAARGATVWPDAASLAAEVECVFLSLPTPPIVEAVVADLSKGAPGGKLRRVVDLSTTGPEMAAIIAERLKSVGVALIDAPVSGGVAGAKAASVAIMVAGAEADLAAVQPMLAAIGRIFPVGDRPGLGQDPAAHP